MVTVQPVCSQALATQTTNASMHLQKAMHGMLTSLLQGHLRVSDDLIDFF